MPTHRVCGPEGLIVIREVLHRVRAGNHLWMPQHSDHRAMPRLALSAAQETAADEAGGSDLKFLLTRNGVEIGNQRLFYHHGVTTIEKMANFAEGRDDLVKVLKEHWGLDQENSLPERVQVAAIACAFGNAKARSQRTAEVDAEFDVQDRAKPIVPGEWTALRSSLERRQGPVEDRMMPAKEYIEKKMAEVEGNEYRAEALTEVLTKDEVEPDSMVPVWDVRGRMTLKRGTAKVAEPANAEELRRRLTVMRNAHIMISLKHTNRAELQGDWSATFEVLKDYLLGEFVHGLSAKDSEGQTIASPPWSLVLAYEHAIRKNAAKLVNTEGKTWVVAIKESIKDGTVKERHFTTPLALYAKRPTSSKDHQPSSYRKVEPNPKQKGRGRGKTSGRPSGAQHCASHTPEGDMICYRFNTPGEKCRAKSCKFKHVCGICFSDKHSLPQCTAKTRQDPPPDTAGRGSKWDGLRVLYLFSGRARKNSLGGCLRQLARRHEIMIQVVELDIQRDQRHDFTLPAIQKAWLQKIHQGDFFAVVSTPPCSTFSRAPWANEKGPYPLRSRKHLWGFPWNSGKRQAKADLGNTLGLFSYEAVRRQAMQPGKLYFKEQPEDLGSTRNARVPGHQPTSMWQMPQFQQILGMEGAQTVVFPQSAFGTESVKPTRFLMRTVAELHPSMREGTPQFDTEGFYLGPLEKMQGKPLIGHKPDGAFRTSGSAAWPPKLCQWVAQQIVDAYLQYRANMGEESTETTRKRAHEEEGGMDLPLNKRHRREEVEVEVDPMDPPVKGGEGKPRSCVWKGEECPFHDGGGLCSAGRWRRGRRKYCETPEWIELRKRFVGLALRRAGSEGELEKEAFRMAFKMVRDEEFISEVVEVFRGSLGLDVEDVRVAEGQPFRLRLMRKMLESCGDPDFEFLEQAEEGLPLGILNDLPRTPAIYERQTKWSLDEVDDDGEWVFQKSNCVSAEEHEEHLRSHLEAEVADGLMEKVPEEEFVRLYGENRAVAALAVLVEDETVGKKRVIHDGTHGVAVNNRMRCKDKVRMPGPREKRELLREFREERATVLSMVGDVEKAHRRFLYAREERGFLACKAADGDRFVYVNKVGTFGVTSTPYWWSRLSAAFMRIMHQVVGPDFPIEALLYADDLEMMGPGKKGRMGAVLGYVAMAAVGTPFKWKKQRGGLVTEWVGFNTDYRTYSMGLTERRSQWVQDWISQLEERKEVSDREFAAGLGRLSFASLALPWERPLLGPLFAWSAAIRGSKGMLFIPWAILFILGWIKKKLATGMRMEQVELRHFIAPKRVRVWTDAKATDERAWIGGWLEISGSRKDSPWFSYEVTTEMAPWLYMRARNPKRMIAALEFLATVVALKFWMDEDGCEAQVYAEAFTDNRGNRFILRKSLSTKFPLTLLVIEVSEMMRKKNAMVDLLWIKRDLNQDADDLTNEEFGNFSEENRVYLKDGKIQWEVMDDLLSSGMELYEGIKQKKEDKKLEKENKRGGKEATSRKKRKFFQRWTTWLE